MKKLLLLFILFSAFTKIYAQLRFDGGPFMLSDSGALIEGNVSSIEIRNNYIVDSIRSNFRHFPPNDTTAVNPYSSIRVAGPRITVSFSTTQFVPISESMMAITPVDPSQRRADTAIPVPPAGFYQTDQYVRISLNGKQLFDWKPVDSLPKKLCRFRQEVAVPGPNKPIVWYNYYELYQFCDTTLKIQDHLLIEIKTGSKNRVIDTYNITRVATSPEIRASFSTPDASGSIGVEETTGSSLEKKTLSGPISRN